jgi:hypothetical protein
MRAEFFRDGAATDRVNVNFLPHRAKIFVFATLGIGILCSLIVWRAESSSSPIHSDCTVQFWHWSKQRVLASEEAADLAALPTDAICWWIGVITAEEGTPTFHPRGGRLSGNGGVKEWAVLRLEPSCTQLLDKMDRRILDAVLTAWRRVQSTATGGLQIDWDVPSRLLSRYASFLSQLRHSLPESVGLSCTGLVSWLDAPGIDEVVRAVDWWVPQCYSAGLPEDPLHTTSLVSRIDIAKVLQQSNALERPFRLGLPTFEQASLWDGDGHLLAASLPIALEDALACGLEAKLVPGSSERLVRFHANRGVTIAGRTIPQSSLLLIAEPTVASLRHQFEIVRSQAGQWCRGVSLFRLSSPGDMPSLSTKQVHQAWTSAKDSSLVDNLQWSWEGSAGEWTLVISNPRLSDAVALTHPFRFIIDCLPGLAAPPAPARVIPALDGIPTGPAHATGSLVIIPFVRSGAEVRINFASGNSAPPSCTPFVEEDQCADASP